MRIIAGKKRGLRIGAPKGSNTRPTLDRVREAIFGSIQFELAGKTVLDLFAGSGGMGIEALSRYARFAVFCDNNRASIQAIRDNIKKAGFESESRVYECDFRTAVSRISADNMRVDVVFLDPPYERGLTELALEALLGNGVLSPGWIIVSEHLRELPPALPSGVRARSVKHYGDVEVSILIEDDGL